MFELLTEDETANRLKLSPGHLGNLRVRGEGPAFVKLGRSVRYRVADVDAWVERRLAASTSDAREIPLSKATAVARENGQEIGREWLRRLCVARGMGRQSDDGMWLIDVDQFQVWLSARAEWKGLS